MLPAIIKLSIVQNAVKNSNLRETKGCLCSTKVQKDVVTHLGLLQGLRANISELLHPSSTKPFPLDHSWSDLVSQEHNILLRSTIWIIHQEHAAWENKETREFSAKPEQPVFHRDFILPFSLFTDFSKKTPSVFFILVLQLSQHCRFSALCSFWSPTHLPMLLQEQPHGTMHESFTHSVRSLVVTCNHSAPKENMVKRLRNN